MTRKAVTPLDPGLVRAILVLGLAMTFGTRPARAQDAPAGPDTAAAATLDSISAETAAPAPFDTFMTGAAVAAPADSFSGGVPAPVEGNPRATSIRKVRLRGSSQNVVRTGPGNGYAIAGVFPQGAVFPVIAKSGPWYNVRLSPTETGWIHSSLCKEFDDLSDLEFRPNAKLFTRTGTYILTGYTGAYAFDRKSNSAVFGGKLGYYVFDRVQVEGGVAWTHVKRPAEIVESLFGLSLEAEEFDMLSYHFLVTYEILPGRQMVPYVSGGVGSSIMLGESEPGFNYGAGTTLYLSKKTAMRWEFRSYRFHTGPDDARVTNNNVEFTLGTSVLF